MKTFSSTEEKRDWIEMVVLEFADRLGYVIAARIGIRPQYQFYDRQVSYAEQGFGYLLRAPPEGSGNRMLQDEYIRLFRVEHAAGAARFEVFFRR